MVTPHHIAGDNTIQPAIAAFTIAVADRLIINPKPKTQSAHRSHMFSLFIPPIIIAFTKPSQESVKNLTVSRCLPTHNQSTKRYCRRKAKGLTPTTVESTIVLGWHQKN